MTNSWHKQAVSLFFLLIVKVLYSGEPSFRHYTMDEGLPASEVYYVMQDSRGFIWFATGNGVSRFDGYSFKNYGLEDGLTDNTIFKIFEDHQGKIWFVPFNCKLAYWENGKILNYPYNDSIQTHLSGESSIFSSFYIDKKGTVYLGIYGKGYLEVSSEGNIRVHRPGSHLTNRPIFFIEQVDTTLICGSIYYTESFLEDSFYVNAFGMKKLIPYKAKYKNNNVFALYHNQHIYFSKNDLLLKFNSSNLEQNRLDQRIIWISIDASENLWVGTYGNGLYRYNNADIGTQPVNFLPGKSISSVTNDKENGYWVTTLHNGVYYFPERNITVYNEADEIKSLSIEHLGVDRNGELWFSDQMSNVYIRDRHGKTKKLNVQLPNGSYVNSILPDKYNDKVYILTNQGSFVYENGSGRKFNKYGYKCGVVIPEGKSVWMGHSSLLHKVSGNNIEYTTAGSINYFRVDAIHMDRHGRILTGNLDGAWLISEKTMPVSLANKNRLLANRINDIESSGDTIIFGSNGVGLIFMTDNRVFNLTKNDGLTGNNIRCLVINNNEIWAAANNGLNRLSRSKDGDFQIERYTTDNGLPSNEINDIKIWNGDIWLATNQGLCAFHPDSLSRNTTPPPVFISKILIANKDTTINDSYRLPHDLNNIEIHYTGICYKSNGKIKYKFRLLGSNDQWRYTKQTGMAFPSLEPGQYRFEVLAENNNGILSSKPAKVEFTILPPFWNTWWFGLITISATLTVISAIFYLRLKRIKQKNQLERQLLELKTKAIELEQKALRAQMNPHFIFNSLNSIQRFILENNAKQAELYLAKFAGLMRLILQNSRDDFIPLEDELQALTKYLDIEKLRFKDKFDYEIAVDPKIEPDLTYVPPMLIQPYVENSIIHGFSGISYRGLLRISLEEREDHLLCKVRDNGVGINTAIQRNVRHHTKSVALEVSRERLEVINKKKGKTFNISIMDLVAVGNSTGTEVSIEIPIR